MLNITLPLVVRLSGTGKMPCASFSLPADACITGSKLRLIPGSVCSDCYAMKGRYRMPNVREPREWNLQVWRECKASGRIADWVEAMVKAIGPKATHFRWFDSGDIQGLDMLQAIIAVAQAMPKVKFWLPTHEAGMLAIFDGVIPANLTIRLSAKMLDSIDNLKGYKTSSVDLGFHVEDSFDCIAYKQGGKCLDCRACWSNVSNINYPLH